MTVKEFIDKLSKFNPDDEVYIEHCLPYEVTIITTDVNDEVVYKADLYKKQTKKKRLTQGDCYMFIQQKIKKTILENAILFFIYKKILYK